MNEKPIDRKELKKSELFSEELGIDLSKNNDEELFKWFLASFLYGNRISRTIAKNTYRTFKKYGLLSPEKILEAGWDYLVNPIMREGGYVRYDGVTSTELLRICKKLIDEYNGSLKELHKKSKDSEDIERRLDEFYGIGPVTVNIFLRELRPYWKKSNPKVHPLVSEVASKLNVKLKGENRRSMSFARMEAGLIRHKDVIREQPKQNRKNHV